MPTYDYRCNACGHEFELFQRMSESPRRKCPECAQNKLERLIGAGAGVIFKGSGFYETDYRSESYRKGAEAEKKNGDAKADSKSDAASGGESKSGEKKTSADAGTKKGGSERGSKGGSKNGSGAGAASGAGAKT